MRSKCKDLRIIYDCDKYSQQDKQLLSWDTRIELLRKRLACLSTINRKEEGPSEVSRFGAFPASAQRHRPGDSLKKFKVKASRGKGWRVIVGYKDDSPYSPSTMHEQNRSNVRQGTKRIQKIVPPAKSKPHSVPLRIRKANTQGTA